MFRRKIIPLVIILDFGNAGSKGASSAGTQERDTQAAALEADISGYAEKAMELVNKQREENGLPALETDDALTEMANQRAAEIVESYSHTRPDGSDCLTVFDDYPSGLKARGENIAKGQKTPEIVVAAWMDSDGHRRNILNEKAVYGAAACAQAPNGKLYWVTLFAK